MEERTTDEPAASGYVPHLRKPHALISGTTCKTQGCSGAGHVLRNDHEGVDVRVSKRMFRTALAVLDLLIKDLEKREIEVVNEPGYNGGTFAVRGRDRCALSVTEHHRRVEHVLTAQEEARAAKYDWDRPPKWDYVASGELSISPGGRVDLKDETTVKVTVNEAVAGVERELERKRASREAAEESQRREWERQSRIEQDKQKKESMLKSARQLHEYRLLLEYIEEVRRVGRVPGDQLEPGQTLEQWLAWAEEKARRLHPLC
jgi:hypothetical protein